MEPIINPLYLYLMSIAGKIGFASVTIVTFSSMTAAVTGLGYYCAYDTKNVREGPGKLFKYSFICTVVFGIIEIIVPSERTLIAMMAASCITPDNIVIAEDHIVELIEKIMAAVNKH